MRFYMENRRLKKDIDFDFSADKKSCGQRIYRCSDCGIYWKREDCEGKKSVAGRKFEKKF